MAEETKPSSTSSILLNRPLDSAPKVLFQGWGCSCRGIPSSFLFLNEKEWGVPTKILPSGTHNNNSVFRMKKRSKFQHLRWNCFKKNASPSWNNFLPGKKTLAISRTRSAKFPPSRTRSQNTTEKSGQLRGWHPIWGPKCCQENR